MKKSLMSLLFLFMVSSYANADFYLYDNNELYLVTDKKFYKVDVIDNSWYTTNLWYPIDNYDDVEEYAKNVKDSQAKKANQFIRENRSKK